MEQHNETSKLLQARFCFRPIRWLELGNSMELGYNSIFLSLAAPLPLPPLNTSDLLICWCEEALAEN